jgi:hypothetical protein
MLDNTATPFTQNLLSPYVPKLEEKNISATHIYLGALGVALLAAFFGALHNGALGLIFILLSYALQNMGDLLEGQERSVFGKIINLCIFGVVVFLLGIGYQQNGGAAFALFSFMVLQATEPLNTARAAQQTLSGFHPARLVEDTEMWLFLLLSFLITIGFTAWCAIFGVLCWITAVTRIYTMIKDETEPSRTEDFIE